MAASTLAIIWSAAGLPSGLTASSSMKSFPDSRRFVSGEPSGRPATANPRPLKRSMRPSSASVPIALRTVARLVSKTDEIGPSSKMSPGSSAPVLIADAICRAQRRYSATPAFFCSELSEPGVCIEPAATGAISLLRFRWS
ncbi:hypothetical protein [Mesorhizobium sp. WSM1293]|uniref:hypothetical protein n=1 Tax=Mesorhizobium sp. WSM1293 TaxID=1040984 RepID=UPI001FD9CBFC|nr:hypothetical protein [Mesorhizobium sp. WSM1293]